MEQGGYDLEEGDGGAGVEILSEVAVCLVIFGAPGAVRASAWLRLSMDGTASSYTWSHSGFALTVVEDWLCCTSLANAIIFHLWGWST